MTRLSIGWEEADRPAKFSYDALLLSAEGKYGEAHDALGELIRVIPIDSEKFERILKQAKLLVVHECEESLRWLMRQRSGERDVHSVRIAEQESAAEYCIKAVKALQKFQECDKFSPYRIRDAFTRGLVAALPPHNGYDTWIPDPNLENGGWALQVDERTRSFIEGQSSSNLGLFHLDCVLEETIKALNNWSQSRDAPWNWIGNLYVDPPLSRKARSRLTKCKDADLGVAILGLSVALSAHFRDLTAGKPRDSRYIGEAMPAGGRACWEIVAGYVNAGFDLDEQETAESLKQRWHSLSRRRQVKIYHWSESAVRKPQLSEE